MTNFCLRLGQELKKELEQEAKKSGLTLSSYIRLVLMSRKKS